MSSRIRTKVAIWFIALGLALSLAVNVAMAVALYGTFVKLHFLRIFPLGHVPPDRAAQNAVAGRPTMAFWGDSRAHFWNKVSLADTVAVHDHSHGAMTSSQLLLQLRSESAARTDFAIVQIGINDLHPLGVLQVYQPRAIEQLRDNVIAIRDALLERSDIVILTTIFPPARVPPARRFAWDPTTLQNLADINDLIRKSTDGKRVVLLDAHTLLSDSENYLDENFADGDFFLHVNPGAYVQLNAALRQLLAQHQSARK